MSLSCERMIYIYIGDYCTTLYANTLNEHVKQRVGCMGALQGQNYNYTFMFLMDTMVTMHNYIYYLYIKIKDTQLQTAARNQFLQHTH